jgi:hypothetical protein
MLVETGAYLQFNQVGSCALPAFELAASVVCFWASSKLEPVRMHVCERVRPRSKLVEAANDWNASFVTGIMQPCCHLLS